MYVKVKRSLKFSSKYTRAFVKVYRKRFTTSERTEPQSIVWLSEKNKIKPHVRVFKTAPQTSAGVVDSRPYAPLKWGGGGSRSRGLTLPQEDCGKVLWRRAKLAGNCKSWSQITVLCSPFC